MYARVATFQTDPAKLEGMIGEMRRNIEDTEPPEGLEDTKAVYILVDRESGKQMSIVLFDSEDGMRRGHEALSAMSPPEEMGQRTDVGLYEVPIHMSR